MKVLGINGSARKDGNTAIIMNQVFEELKKQGWTIVKRMDTFLCNLFLRAAA